MSYLTQSHLDYYFLVGKLSHITLGCLHGIHCSSAKSTSLVVATYNPSTRETKMEEVLQIKGFYEFHSEYQAHEG